MGGWLSEKPGCYPSNVGQSSPDGIVTYEAEFKEFINNSPYCPELIKYEYKKSVEKAKNLKQKSKDLEKNTEAIDDISDDDELYIRAGVPKTQDANDDPEDWMNVCAPMQTRLYLGQCTVHVAIPTYIQHDT